MLDMTMAEYRNALPRLELAGFPVMNPRSRLRLIPAIDAYLLREQEVLQLEATGEDPERLVSNAVCRMRERLVENFGTAEERALKHQWGWLRNDKAAIEYSRTGLGPDGKLAGPLPEQ
jgi:hypothetical protein